MPLGPWRGGGVCVSDLQPVSRWRRRRRPAQVVGDLKEFSSWGCVDDTEQGTSRRTQGCGSLPRARTVQDQFFFTRSTTGSLFPARPLARCQVRRAGAREAAAAAARKMHVYGRVICQGCGLSPVWSVAGSGKDANCGPAIRIGEDGGEWRWEIGSQGGCQDES